MSKKRKELDKQLKHDRQISRDKRNSLRKEIKENVSLHRNNEVFHIIFISKETKNMEKILFDMFPLSNGYLINIPIITTQMINECEDKTPKGAILQYFGIESDSIQLIDGTNLIIVKNFRIINNFKNLIELIVCPYNEYTWYDNNCITTLYGERIFKGQKLKDFFATRNDLERLFVFQDTITEILLYRIIQNKISGNEFLNSYCGSFYKSTDIETGNKKKQNGFVGWSALYKLIAEDDERLNEILANEENEIHELLSDDDSNPRKLILRQKNNK